MNEVLHPSLAEALAGTDLDPQQLTVGVPFDDGVARPSHGRASVFLVSGERFVSWEVPSLRALFRGAAAPPSMQEYPAAYVPCFYLLERHVLTASKVGRVPTDGELDEMFANLRRRPDGRSLGPIHDLLWQASALLLGRYELSEAEYGAVVGRLSRSASGWKTGLSSREYVSYLTRTFEG